MVSTHPSIRSLNREWRSLIESSGAALRTWACLHPALASCADLDEVLAAIRMEPDALLAGLLARGATGDALAHRVVLQTMLGSVVRLAAADPRHGVDDYLAELWLGIVTYPLVRRPRSIAANLALDARKRVWARERALPVDPVTLALVPAPAPEPEPSVPGVLAEAERLGLIDARTRLTLRVVYGEGLRSAQAAGVLATTPEVVRWRCSRALRRLAAHAEALVPA